MRVFLDANSFLAFFSEDAESRSLEELKRLIEAKKLELFYTEQVKNEYTRNIADRIHQTRERILGSTLELKYKAAEDKELEGGIKLKVAEINKAFEAAQNKRLVAYDERVKKTEKLVESLFSLGKHSDYSEEIIEKSQTASHERQSSKKEKR
jgi:predicted nucleic acid-binding protein